MALFQRTPKMSAGNLAHLLAQEIANTIIEDSTVLAAPCGRSADVHGPRLACRR